MQAGPGIQDLPWRHCPLEEARREWLEAQGRSAFLEWSVPEAALRLKQQLGRLLRTTDDHGTATILDRRIVTRRWGHLLLQGLPDFELVIERLATAKPKVPAVRS